MGWQLEVAKMFMYLSFPVATFYYFNQSKNFEKWVIQEKEAHFPPESKQSHEEMQNFIYEFNAAVEKRNLDQIERQQLMTK